MQTICKHDKTINKNINNNTNNKNTYSIMKKKFRFFFVMSNACESMATRDISRV